MDRQEWSVEEAAGGYHTSVSKDLDGQSLRREEVASTASPSTSDGGRTVLRSGWRASQAASAGRDRLEHLGPGAALQAETCDRSRESPGSRLRHGTDDATAGAAALQEDSGHWHDAAEIWKPLQRH